MAKRKQVEFIQGTAAHRRTERDYMSVLLDTVTLDDWREVIAGALQGAKQGDPTARAWLAQYLMGKPDARAPTPLTVVVQRLSGNDPLVDELAEPIIDREIRPITHQHDEWETSVKAVIAAELAQKIAQPKILENPVTVRDSTT
ncbi:MAG: hypothetical protein U1F68_13070 [Gammaproteobacteria bacterium]